MQLYLKLIKKVERVQFCIINSRGASEDFERAGGAGSDEIRGTLCRVREVLHLRVCERGSSVCALGTGAELWGV